MATITHNFNEINIAQLSEDATIGGSAIPKGYVNATQLCKAGKKLYGHWKATKQAKAYVEALSRSIQIPIDSLMYLNESEGGNDERGTWVHPEVAIEIARWVSPEFNVWANRTLRLVLNGDFQALTNEAATVQKRVQDEWSRILDAPDPWEKFFEKSFCDRICKIYGTEFYWKVVYAVLTPEEYYKIQVLNPKQQGRGRLYCIHQFIEPETKERMKPYLREVSALLNSAADRYQFSDGYMRQFGTHIEYRYKQLLESYFSLIGEKVAERQQSAV